MQATARMASVVSSWFPPRRCLIRGVLPTPAPISMTSEKFIDSLRRIVAPELNHLLTEPPIRPGDFGWYCREHAVVTAALAKSFGHVLKIVHGEVSILVGTIGLTTRTAIPEDKHWWCDGLGLPIVDLSARLDFFRPECKKHQPVMKDGPCGPLGVLITDDPAAHMISYDRPYLVYSPIRTETTSIEEFLTSRSTAFLKTAEAAQITRRIFIHIHRLLLGSSKSYIGRMNQHQALVDLHKIDDSTKAVLASLRGQIS